MHFIVFYLASAGLYGAGAICLRNTSPYSRSGGDNYLKRERRRLIAKTLLTLATMALVLGLMTQFFWAGPGAD